MSQAKQAALKLNSAINDTIATSIDNHKKSIELLSKSKFVHANDNNDNNESKDEEEDRSLLLTTQIPINILESEAEIQVEEEDSYKEAAAEEGGRENQILSTTSTTILTNVEMNIINQTDSDDNHINFGIMPTTGKVSESESNSSSSINDTDV